MSSSDGRADQRRLSQRRARLVTRHLLDGSASSALEAAQAVVVLHATDAATVYLSALARGAGLDIGDVAKAMYHDRSLVRMLAMRRTLFVVPTELAPVVHSAASVDVAARIRKRLVKELSVAPTDPELPLDVERWLREAEAGVARVVAELGVASGAQIGAAEPRLRTAILPRTDKRYDVRRTVTTNVLTLMAAEGRLVRREPLGPWTSRQHTWESATAWWPEGIPEVPAAEARARLAEAYLRRFGPATEADLAWWTGWPLGLTRTALDTLALDETPEGLVMADDTGDVDAPPPRAALLPALDPTPMGWKDRAWYLPEDPRPLYDAYGNVGPTVWWDGEVIGGWAVRRDGTLATRLLVDRGVTARRAVEEVAEALCGRLGGTVVVPSFRTPLERELSA